MHRAFSRGRGFGNSWTTVGSEERREKPPATLGGVLYPNQSSPVVIEEDWVALVDAIGRGDQSALHALYERIPRPVFTLIARLTRNRETAEELTVDVFHDVWRRAEGYDPANGTVVGWIMNQARSRAIDRLRFDHRKKRVDPHAGEPVQTETALGSDAMVESEEARRTLHAALAQLSTDEKQAIEATYFGELTHVEAAAALDQPLGTIKTRIRTAIQKLRAALDEKSEEP
jgi:RNA polymerase sigma-70 factor (ECF subfamily)